MARVLVACEESQAVTKAFIKLGKVVSSWYAEKLKQGKGNLKEVSRIRSKTFDGIAYAMATQWGNFI